MTRLLSIVALIILLVYGCAGVKVGGLSKEQLANASEIAREKALSQLELTESEQDLIRTDHPRWGYYKISGDYAQYYFLWDLPSGVTVRVFGTGDMLTLQGASVEKTEIARELRRTPH